MIGKKNIPYEQEKEDKSINLRQDQPMIQSDISNQINNQLKEEISENLKIVNDLPKFSDIKNDNKQIILKEKWEQILSKIELPSTRMLLSQQAELQSFNSSVVEIALAPNWANMIKSRKVVIESAIKKLCGDEVKIKFSSKELKNNDSINTQETINKKNNNQSIKNNSQENCFGKKFSNEESYKDSSKNLANFFNGEIIDLEE